MKLSATNIYSKVRAKIISKILRKITPKPWMEDWEIDIIKEILLAMKPKKCLEWSAGFSTIYFTKLLPKRTKWISMEHDKKWANKVKNKILIHSLFGHCSKVEVIYIPPNHFPWTDKHGDGSYDDLKDYVDFPSKFKFFDFILVDGRARIACLSKAHKLIKRDGVVILHDANRIYYHQPFALYKYQLLLNNHRQDTGGLWLGSKGIDVKSLLSY